MKTHTHTDSLAQYPDRVISPKAFHGIFLSPLKSHFNPCVCFDLLHGSSSMSRVKTKKAIRIECTTCARACVRVCVCQISRGLSRDGEEDARHTHCLLRTPQITIHPCEAFVSQLGRVIVIGRSNYGDSLHATRRKCHQTEALFYLS